MDFGSLSDEELSQMLIDYGVDVGPINVATRSTYERKLFKLKTGKAQPQQKVYDPVEDDDDNEVELRMPATSTPSSGRGSAPVHTPSAIPVPTSSYTPVNSQVRSRREVVDHSSIPRIDSRPPLSTSRRVTKEETFASPASKRTDGELGYRKISSPVDVKTREVTAERTPVVESSGIPAWVKLLSFLVVVVLCYLIYSNMEETAVNNIPHLSDKVEV